MLFHRQSYLQMTSGQATMPLLDSGCYGAEAGFVMEAHMQHICDELMRSCAMHCSSMKRYPPSCAQATESHQN